MPRREPGIVEALVVGEVGQFDGAARRLPPLVVGDHDAGFLHQLAHDLLGAARRLEVERHRHSVAALQIPPIRGAHVQPPPATRPAAGARLPRRSSRRAKGGDHLLAVKGNQPIFHQPVHELISNAQTVTAGHEGVDRTDSRTVLQLSWSAPGGTEIDTRRASR